MRESTRILVEDLEKEDPKPGLSKIIELAKKDSFHDFFGVYDFPQMTLLEMLRNVGASRQIKQNVVDGKYDATKEEAKEWAASPEGQATFNEFYSSIGKKNNDRKNGEG